MAASEYAHSNVLQSADGMWRPQETGCCSHKENISASIFSSNDEFILRRDGIKNAGPFCCGLTGRNISDLLPLWLLFEILIKERNVIYLINGRCFDSWEKNQRPNWNPVLAWKEKWWADEVCMYLLTLSNDDEEKNQINHRETVDNVRLIVVNRDVR